MSDIRVGKYIVNDSLEPVSTDNGQWRWLAAVSNSETNESMAISLTTETRERPTPEQFIADYEQVIADMDNNK